MSTTLRFTFLGLSITSSWGNGHATTYRALLKALAARGHEVTFLERDQPYYAENRDAPSPPFAQTHLYRSLDELKGRFDSVVREADVVVVGSYVPEGAAVGAWACALAPRRTAFYDIDTPVTLAKLAAEDHEYLTPELVRRYALYLSFTGGPTLRSLERDHGSPCAQALYCSVDPDLYFPDDSRELTWDLGYLGTYSTDRQPTLERLLVVPAKGWPAGRFIVAGAQYPEGYVWPANVAHACHVPPGEHRDFYTGQRFTLNVTRAVMRIAGWSPSVRLFEAAACATPIVSDRWAGLETLLEPGREVLVADETSDVDRLLRGMNEDERRAIGRAARERVLREHTAEHRAEELENHVLELLDRSARRARTAAPRVAREVAARRGES